MKLRITLYLIIFYLVLVFGWWLYSFLKYAKIEYEYKNTKLEHNCQIVKNKSEDFIHSQTKKISNIELLNNRNTFEKINKDFGEGKTNLIIDTLIPVIENKIIVKPKIKELEKVQEHYLRRKRTYYSEVIFLGAAFLLGLIWVFGRLEYLLNLNKIQNNFLLSVTHELKTPLSAIKLSTETLNRKDINEDQKNILIKQILNNSNRLNELLDNVLLSTRIEGNIHTYQFEKQNLIEFTEQIINEFKTMNLFKGSINLKSDNENIENKFDKIAIKLVLNNLFSNSIKYAGENCKIDIFIEQIDKKILIHFKDNGPGIDSKHLSNIFKKFYRIGDENTRKTQGTGLGLYLSSQIINSHKGKLTALKNENGAYFLINLQQQI